MEKPSLRGWPGFETYPTLFQILSNLTHVKPPPSNLGFKLLWGISLRYARLTM